MKINNYRKSIRLNGWDYTRPGAYFITIVVKDRMCLFGKIANGKMRCNDYGLMVNEEWLKTSEIRKNVVLDEFVVMPNHFHGIIVLHQQAIQSIEEHQYDRTILRRNISGLPEKATHRVAADVSNDQLGARSNGPASGSIGAIVGQFKSIVSKRINRLRGTPGDPIWQRDYYDHIGRNPKDLDRIRRYIRNNPLKWELDSEYSKTQYPLKVSFLTLDLVSVGVK
jgi:putative transposase